ncbi:MAG: K(+)-transporting ATPase subunit F [Tepidisphaeraceae bacterium]|jgi:K+-transporting ATPase KdpF subunit
MTAENVIVGLICLVLMGYLFLALLMPEKF